MPRVGRWKKGQTGNPNGRPKVVEEFRAKCRRAVDQTCIDAWIDEVALRPRKYKINGVEVEKTERGPDWIRASEFLANYGYGKPSQPLEHSGAEGKPLGISVRFVEGAK